MIEIKDYRDYEDFAQNFTIPTPENFNFAFDCVDELAKESPEKLALLWCNDEGVTKRYTFGDLKKLSDMAAKYFLSIGIGKNDKVMLILRRQVEFWIAVLALMKVGAVAIPATHHLTSHDIVYRNNSASIVAIITTDDEKLIKEVEKSIPESGTVKHLIRIGKKEAPFAKCDWQLFDGEIKKFENDAGFTIERVTENQDMMLLYFTSGTTGLPKMVSHNYIYPLAHIATAKYWHNLNENSLHLTLSDTGWGKAVWGKLFGQWLCKATVMVYEHDKLTAHRLLKVIENNKVTSFCAPPTAYRVLINANFENYDLSSLEYATSAGEPLNEDVFNKFKEYTGLSIHEAYGQTETTPLVMTTPYSIPRPGSIGKPNPFYDLRFIGTDGEEVSCGEEGEMCIKINPGDMGVFMGYYKNDEMTEYAWREGYYHTGDLAKQDADGYVWFIGRSDDIIKSAGYRIGPFEVESIVQEHDAVMECAVTGIPDPLRGQLIKVSIILNEGYEPSDSLKKEIRGYVKSNAAAYKVPRVIEFVKEFPKTISGKIKRTDIRKADSEK